MNTINRWSIPSPLDFPVLRSPSLDLIRSISHSPYLSWAHLICTRYWQAQFLHNNVVNGHHCAGELSLSSVWRDGFLILITLSSIPVITVWDVQWIIRPRYLSAALPPMKGERDREWKLSLTTFTQGSAFPPTLHNVDQFRLYYRGRISSLRRGESHNGHQLCTRIWAISEQTRVREMISSFFFLHLTHALSRRASGLNSVHNEETTAHSSSTNEQAQCMLNNHSNRWETLRILSMTFSDQTRWTRRFLRK